MEIGHIITGTLKQFFGDKPVEYRVISVFDIHGRHYLIAELCDNEPRTILAEYLETSEDGETSITYKLIKEFEHKF